MSSSYSCNDNLTGLHGTSSARPIPVKQSPGMLVESDSIKEDIVSGGSGHSGSPNSFRNCVSSSAPAASIDLDHMVRSSGEHEPEVFRDRRKKDIHNMSMSPSKLLLANIKTFSREKKTVQHQRPHQGARPHAAQGIRRVGPNPKCII